MRILIGVDDSPHSRAAVEYVRRMAWPKGSIIRVLSVVQPLVSPFTLADVSVATEVARQHEDAVRFHQETAAKAEGELQATGLATEAKVVNGDPRTELVEAAIAERADLLIVGSHGRTGVAKLLMGSVAAYVVTHAPCSVLVVKLAGHSKPSPRRNSGE